jgi:Holliday junction resolvase RusA-like endonuclease
MKMFKNLWNKLFGNKAEEITRLEEIIAQLTFENKQLQKEISSHNNRPSSDYIQYQRTINNLKKENRLLGKRINDLLAKVPKTTLEPMHQIRLGIHGFSTNRMYETVNNEIHKTESYRKWRKQFNQAMDVVTKNKASKIFWNVNFKRRIKVDVCFGILPEYDVDNMIKSFLDSLVAYYNLPNDNNVFEINLKKQVVSSYKDAFISFNVDNI